MIDRGNLVDLVDLIDLVKWVDFIGLVDLVIKIYLVVTSSRQSHRPEVELVMLVKNAGLVHYPVIMIDLIDLVDDN